ncbi:MAG: hypothetical protein IAF38_06725 [Bacteroidia bacterium]|nr:hypothetical protein [Bacteroidia bacterium]
MILKTKISVLSLFICLVGVFKLSAQCPTDNCSHKLGDFTFIKSVSIDPGKVEGKPYQYSYLFSKGSTYMILICDQSIKGSRLIVNLYDASRKLIATNHNKKKIYESLTFPCNSTGIYYIESFYEGNKDACGVNILGFTKTAN